MATLVSKSAIKLVTSFNGNQIAAFSRMVRDTGKRAGVRGLVHANGKLLVLSQFRNGQALIRGGIDCYGLSFPVEGGMSYYPL